MKYNLFLWYIRDTPRLTTNPISHPILFWCHLQNGCNPILHAHPDVHRYFEEIICNYRTSPPPHPRNNNVSTKKEIMYYLTSNPTLFNLCGFDDGSSSQVRIRFWNPVWKRYLHVTSRLYNENRMLNQEPVCTSRANLRVTPPHWVGPYVSETDRQTTCHPVVHQVNRQCYQ